MQHLCLYFMCLVILSQVKQSDIHQIWENDVSDLQRKIQVRAYPPQITVEIAGQGAFDNATESFSFDGGVHGVDRLCREIHLVLPEEYVGEHLYVNLLTTLSILACLISTSFHTFG